MTRGEFAMVEELVTGCGCGRCLTYAMQWLPSLVAEVRRLQAIENTVIQRAGAVTTTEETNTIRGVTT